MTLVVSHPDVAGSRTVRQHEDSSAVALTHFMDGGSVAFDPQVMLVEESPFRTLRVHYHEQDEFQIFLAGNGTNGRHAIAPFQVHFARKNTPYGPIVAADEGCTFLTLRSRRDRGARFMPESRQLLDGIEGRAPWQVSADVTFAADGDAEPALQPLAGLQDDHGLAAASLRLPPRALRVLPDPAATDGQFVVVLRGSLLHAGLAYPSLTVVFVEPQDGSFTLRAGEFGLDAIVMNLPRQIAAAPLAAAGEPGQDGNFKVWQCVLCGFVYDENAGLPEEGIAPGTRWADVPESFGCPDCSASKADFEMMEL